MSSTKRRHLLYEHAKHSWGTETAEALMDFLPHDPNQLATKTDLVVLGAELRTEMAQQTRALVLALVTIEVTILLAVLGVVLTA